MNDIQKRIIEMIEKKSTITQKEMAAKLGISRDKIKRNIEKLKKTGIIERIGATKNGYWKIK